MRISVCKTSDFRLCHSLNIAEIWSINDARKQADWMMISTENIYVIVSLNSHENGTKNTLCHPHVRIMADKK